MKKKLEELQENLKLGTLERIIKKHLLKYKGEGHVIKFEDDKWTKSTIVLYPAQEKRSRGIKRKMTVRHQRKARSYMDKTNIR